MESNYSRLLKTKDRIMHLGTNHAKVDPSEKTPIGDDANLGHIFDHAFNTPDGAPLPDIYSITKEQMGMVLQSFKYNFEISRFGDKIEPNYERDHGFVNYGEFYLIIYMVMYSKTDPEIQRTINTWRSKIHDNKEFKKIKTRDLKDFDTGGYDRWYEGLYLGIEEYIGKDISIISDSEYIKYARFVVENMDKYKNIKKLGAGLREVKFEYMMHGTNNYTGEELNDRINNLLQIYKKIPLQQVQEIFDVNFTDYRPTSGEITEYRNKIVSES
jgi:hypothetical protein